MLVVAYIFLVQNMKASILAGIDIDSGNIADLDVGEAENATMTAEANYTANGNVTGAGS